MGDPNFYQAVCEKRFDDHDKKINTVDEKVDKLTVIVSNGLSSRVKRIDRLMWLLIGAILAEAIVGRFF